MKSIIKEFGLFFVVLVAILVLRYFFWFAVKVDGHSMDPTLAGDERLVVVKHTNISRGDIVVANEVDTVTGEEKAIVKRVIGMPGDAITYDNDVLTVNGKVVKETYISDFLNQFKKDKLQAEYAYDLGWQQQAFESPAFTTLNNQADFSVQIPEGEYYLMGDNRIISKDSRAVGPFKSSAILGEVKFRYWPLSEIGFIG
jgi:signal peptidase I